MAGPQGATTRSTRPRSTGRSCCGSWGLATDVRFEERAHRMMCRARVALVWVLVLAAATVTPVAVEKPALAARGEAFPHRLGDAQFWQLVTGFTESGGTFLS